MTAFGLLLVVLGVVGLNVSDEPIIEIPAAIFVIVGLLLAVIGVLVWVWKVMP